MIAIGDRIRERTLLCTTSHEPDRRLADGPVSPTDVVRALPARPAYGMNAPLLSPYALCAIIAITGTLLTVTVTAAHETSNDDRVRNDMDTGSDDDELKVRKIELYDGVSMKVPRSSGNDTKLLSFELDLNNKDIQEGRGEKKNNLMQRILPLFIMPFLLQSAIVPMFLSMLKFMLMKSLMVGKIALALIAFNAFKNHNSVKGRDTEIANVHYGYHGDGMEYGAYINK